MKTLLAVLIVLVYSALPCVAQAVDTSDLDLQMDGRIGCALVYDLSRGDGVLRYHPSRCAMRVSPCSTFKIPVAVMAFDRHLIDGPKTRFEWDGTVREREELNADQTAASWLQNSVVWVTQELTRRLGMPTVQRYLRAFRYGNRDMSGGLTRAWLTSSLSISADEQMTFLRALWHGRLAGAAASAQRRTIALLPTLTVPRGVKGDSFLCGKTGSGQLADGRDLGWYVGYLTRPGGRTYAIVINFEDRTRGITHGPPGWVARDMALHLATRLP